MEAASAPVLGWLVVLIAAGAAVAALVMVRAKKVALASPILLLLLVGGFYFVRAQPREVVPATEVSQERAADGVQSTEDMWDRLTEARIPLDEKDSDDDPSEPEKPARPDWVDNAPSRVGDIYRTVVVSDPFTTVDECFAQLEQSIPDEVRRHLANIIPPQQKQLVKSHLLDEMGVTLDYVMRQICQQEFTESYESSVGDMKRVHVLMEFSPEVEEHLRGRWQSLVRDDGLMVVVKIATLVLAVLASVYGLLQLDTWTRGYYTNRLLLGASAAIIAIAVILFVS